MAKGYERPATPLPVERRLRQEAGFGCARCGHPYVEYHHIVPFSEEAHFRPEEMVALCGNCHPAVSKFERDRQYEIKAKPFNKVRGFMNGALAYDKRDLIFKVGGNYYENVPTILQYNDLPIISCHQDEGEIKISINILNKYGAVALSIDKNNISFRVDDLWDFEYSHNEVVARYGPSDIGLRLDFRKPEAIIEGKLWLGGNKIRLSPSKTTLQRNTELIGNKFMNLKIGIHVAEK